MKSSSSFKIRWWGGGQNDQCWNKSNKFVIPRLIIVFLCQKIPKNSKRCELSGKRKPLVNLASTNSPYFLIIEFTLKNGIFIYFMKRFFAEWACSRKNIKKFMAGSKKKNSLYFVFLDANSIFFLFFPISIACENLFLPGKIERKNGFLLSALGSFMGRIRKLRILFI